MKPTLVLLHGFGEDARIWDGFRWFLQKDYHVLCPDYAQLSHLPTLDHYADWLHQQLQAAQVRSCVLVGHSMGGYIALAFAERHGGMLQGLSLFHSTAAADSEERKALRLKNVAFLEAHGGAAFVQNFSPNLFSEAFGQAHPELLAQHIQRYSQLPTEALVMAMEAMRQRPDRQSVLAQISYPVQFVIGMLDKSVAPADVIGQTKQTQQPQIDIFQEVAHMGMYEDPFETLLALRFFVRRCVGTSSFDF
jgi:pimeloyl-ACP methyl ester carboxylesterase